MSACWHPADKREKKQDRKTTQHRLQELLLKEIMQGQKMTAVLPNEK